jgi:hypothetical protein
MFVTSSMHRRGEQMRWKDLEARRGVARRSVWVMRSLGVVYLNAVHVSPRATFLGS